MERLKDPRTRLRLVVAIALCLTALAVGLTALVINGMDGTRAALMDRAYRAQLDTEHLDAAFTRRIASGRGYLLTGNQEFLRDRAAARADFATTLQAVRASYPALRAMLAPIDDVSRRLIEASDRATKRRDDDLAAALGVWERDVNPIQIEVHAILRSAIAEAELEHARATERVASAVHRGRVLLITVAIAAVSAMALLLALLIRGHQGLLRGALRVKERELLQILEQIPVGVFVRSADGSPYYANRSARDILGAPDAAGHYRLYEAGTEHLYPMERAPINRALGGETVEVSDMELRRNDGDIVPLHVRGAPVFGASGALAYAVAAFQDVRALHRHAMRDSLTGLANRASVHQTYRRDRQVAERGGRPLSVGLIDLDHFKSINDRHGHAMGDHVLQSTAATIVDSLRAADLVARWGGEEILVVLPDTDLDGARTAVDKVLTAVRGLMFFDANRNPFEVTFSAGVATARAGEHLDAVVARADAALYKAKRAGRCRVLDESVVKVATAVLSVAVPEPPTN